MVVNDIKPLVKGKAELQYVMGGGICVWHITADDGRKFQLEIDMSDKHDLEYTKLNPWRLAKVVKQDIGLTDYYKYIQA